MSRKMTKGPVRLERTDPHRTTLGSEPPAAKQEAHQQYKPEILIDQHAMDRTRAAFEIMSSADQQRFLALANITVVLRRAERGLAPKEAAARAGCSSATILRWAEKHDLGRKIGGRWAVDGAKLAAFLDGGRHG